MTGAEYLQRTAERMAADGNEVRSVQLGGGVILIGYQSEFRVLWGANKLHLFTAAAAVPLATPEIQASLTSDVMRYAKDTKGRFRGVHTGVAVISALVADMVTPEARTAVERRPEKEFAAVSKPVIVDLGAGRVYTYEGRILWGAAYTAWMRERSAAVFPPPG